MGMRVVAGGIAVPDYIQTAEELAPLIGKTAEWIVKRCGVRNRRTGPPEMGSPQLAAQAARIALAGQLQPDLILYAGGVKHQAVPDTSVFVSHALGFDGVPSFSIDATCLSFLVAFQTADALIACGRYNRILICSADVGSRARRMTDPESAALLGDGAAAVLLEKADIGHQVLHFSMKTWPSASSLAEIRGGGTRMIMENLQHHPDINGFWMDGRGLLKLLLPRLTNMVETCCHEAGIRVDDIDLIVPHQTSKAGFQLLGRIGLRPEKTINILENHGNCVAAAIPMALVTAMESNRISPGKLVLFIGSAAGVSAATMLVRW